MPVIDDRGRLFGKVNLIDAVVGVVVLGLIPLAYGAFLLFRVPAPKITSVTPAQVIAHQAGTVEITGEDLRPFLRARLGTFESNGFLVQSPTRAEIKLPDLPVGTYDLGLSDQGQELVRKPSALTVVAPPLPPPLSIDVQAVGAFVGLASDDARLVSVGAKFERRRNEEPAFETAAPGPGRERDAENQGPIAEVLAMRAPEPGRQRVRIGTNVFATAPLPGELRVPAIIRLSCAVVNGECKVGDTVVAQSATVTLPWSLPPSKGKSARPRPREVRFLIDEVRPADARVAFPSVRTAVATVRVRFVAGPEVLDVMKVGDVDLSGSVVVPDADRAVLTDVGPERQALTAITNTEGLLRRSLQIEQPVLAFTGTVRVPVVFTPSGWSYRDRPVKVGAAFTFETLSGAMIGWILDTKLGPETVRVAP